MKKLKKCFLGIIIMFCCVLLSCENDEMEEPKPEPNTAPTARMIVSPSGFFTIDSTFTLDASTSFDKEDSILNKYWFKSSKEGNCNRCPMMGGSLPDVVETQFKEGDLDSLNQITLTLVVEDREGLTDTTTKILRFSDETPIISLEVNPLFGSQITVFEFDASKSRDALGSMNLTIRWDWDNDGDWDTEKLSYSESNFIFEKSGFRKNGRMLVKAEIEDSYNHRATDTIGFNLELLPDYQLIYPTDGQLVSDTVECELKLLEPNSNLFHMIQYYDENTGKFEINLGTVYGAVNAADNLIVKPKIYTEYFDDGFYQIRAFAYTQSSIVFYSDTITIEISNGWPTAYFTVDPEEGSIITNFNFDASGSSDPQDDVSKLQFKWDFDSDGNYEVDWTSIATTSYQYETPGEKIVTLEVKDTEDHSSVFQDTINVKGVFEILEKISDYNNLSDVEELDGVVNFTVELDPGLVKYENNNIVTNFIFYENSTSSIKYGGFTQNSQGNVVIAFSSSGVYANDYTMISIDPDDPETLLNARRYEYFTQTGTNVLTLDDIEYFGSYLYGVDDFTSKLYVFDETELSYVKEYDIQDVGISYDKVWGLTSANGYLYFITNNNFANGSTSSQVVKVTVNSSSINIVARYNIDDSISPTGIGYISNEQVFYVTGYSGVYILSPDF